AWRLTACIRGYAGLGGCASGGGRDSGNRLDTDRSVAVPAGQCIDRLFGAAPAARGRTRTHGRGTARRGCDRGRRCIGQGRRSTGSARPPCLEPIIESAGVGRACRDCRTVGLVAYSAATAALVERTLCDYARDAAAGGSADGAGVRA